MDIKTYIYVCISVSQSVWNAYVFFTFVKRNLYNYFVVPVPLTKITIFDETLENISLGNVTIGDPLPLDCTVTAVRGISSLVDIIWTTGGKELRRAENITANIESDNTIYTDSFEISSLSAFDNGREFQCTVVINANQPVDSSDQITLLFPGEYSNVCIYNIHTYLHIYVHIQSLQSYPCITSLMYMYIAT